jgi:hypothetical protein
VIMGIPMHVHARHGVLCCAVLSCGLVQGSMESPLVLYITSIVRCVYCSRGQDS